MGYNLDMSREWDRHIEMTEKDSDRIQELQDEIEELEIEMERCYDVPDFDIQLQKDLQSRINDLRSEIKDIENGDYCDWDE